MPNRRLYTGPEVQSLDAGWLNYDGTATIYLTQDPTLNRPTLALANHTSGPVVIPEGSLNPYGSAPEGTGGLYLYFNGLLTNAEVEALTVDTPGWSAQAYVDPATSLAYLALAPASSVSLAVSETLSLALGGLTATGSARAGNLTLVMDGLQGAPAGSGLQSIFVNVAAGPQAGNARLDLLVGFAGPDFVFTGGHHNELLLVMTNPGTQPVVPGGAATYGSDPPTFTFSFVLAPNGQTAAGALTDVAGAEGISIDLAQTYGNTWNAVERDDQGATPTWTVEAGGTVLGTGASASMSFRISGITSSQPAGATFLYVAYTGVPGYDDGYFAVEIVKVAPTLAALVASPDAFSHVTTTPQTTLQWSVINATYVTITGTSFSKAITASSDSGEIYVPVPATTSYTLLATNAYTGQTAASGVTVTVAPDLYTLLPLGTIVMWSGPAQSPPTGWALCDGREGRPNLVNQFVLGADDHNVVVGSAGGDAYHSHTASGTVSIGNAGDHHHGMPSNWYSNKAGSGGDVTVVDRHASSVSKAVTQTAGSHNHPARATVTVDDAYVMPPWYALAFIVRVA
jgi:hypothetical protein